MQKIYFLLSYCLLAFFLPVKAQDSTLAPLHGKWTAVKLSVKILSHPDGQPEESYETADPLRMIKAGRDVLTGIGFGTGIYEAERSGAGERGTYFSTGRQTIQLQEQLPPGLQASTIAKNFKWQVTGNILTLESGPTIYRNPTTGRFVQATFVCIYSKN